MSENVVVVSNRGPVSFSIGASGEVSASRGGGGLISALGPAVRATQSTWLAGAISEADRRAAEAGSFEAEGYQLRLLDVDEESYRAYYDVVANSTLWYLYHGLFDTPRRPRFDRRFREAWAAYRDVNAAFADAVAATAPPDATVLVQDYHFSLLGPRLAKERSDLRTVHFHHTPFCGPNSIRMLPGEVASELFEGLAGYGACGFHSERWARGFEASSREVLGFAPKTFASPASPDLDDIRSVARSEECENAFLELDRQVGDRLFLVRVDRIELSKNLLRGFQAFADLLRSRPEWRERVVFGAFVYPSRTTLADYQSYAAEVESLVHLVNQEFGTPTWTPILLDMHDDFPRSVAALRRYDVLVVNPIRDGLNLVAKEGAAVNERDGVLALSRESGVWDELGEWAFPLNPFDVAGTADALHAALSAPPEERAERARALRAEAERRSPLDWFSDQVEAASA